MTFFDAHNWDFDFFGRPELSTEEGLNGVSLSTETERRLAVEPVLSEMAEILQRSWDMPLADLALALGSRSMQLACVAQGLEGNRDPGMESAANRLESIAAGLRGAAAISDGLPAAFFEELLTTVDAVRADVRQAILTRFRKGQ